MLFGDLQLCLFWFARAMRENKKRLKAKAVEGVKAAAARIKARDEEVLK